MQQIKFFVGVIVVSSLLILGGIYFARTQATQVGGQANRVEQNNGAKVLVTEMSYDWGEIKLDGGNVEKEFEIKNEGDGVLSLYNVFTSCMCTTAKLELEDSVSPVFGMHTKSSYVMNVKSGEVAKLKVVFDPAYHGPSGVGEITRQVKVSTNDPSNPELTFDLAAIVSK